MTYPRDQFARLCASMGLCSFKDAEAYALTRTELTDEDFIEVHRQAETKPCAWLNRMGNVQGAHTTKRFMHSSRDMKE